MTATYEHETTSTAVAIRGEDGPSGTISAFGSQGNFESAQRIAKALASSSLVPKEYQSSLANCLVAMELASRTGASVLMVMQNLHLIQGRPSWSSTFLIASVNACGRFTPIRYERRGAIDDPAHPKFALRAVARDRASGEVLEGEWISWDMVKGEGWLAKAGSKWKTMPGQMFRYRAAAFWVRAYAPEISLGMHTSDEVEDVVAPSANASANGGAHALNAAVRVTSIVEQGAPSEVSEAEPTSSAPLDNGTSAGDDVLADDRDLFERENGR